MISLSHKTDSCPCASKIRSQRYKEIPPSNRRKLRSWITNDK